MMKKIKFFIVAFLVFTNMGYLNFTKSCTRVFLNKYGYMISARNLDYFSPSDPSLVVTPRYIKHTGGSGKGVAEWTTKYGSVMIYADDIFPMDGMNEKGLAGHTLFYTNGVQEQKDNLDKPIIESSAWLSYLLDNFATVAEAIEGLKNVRMVAKQLPVDYATDAKHIAIEDATGNSAIIEIENGEVKVWQGQEYTVMTNPPSYDIMLKKLSSYSNATYDNMIWDLSSESRFIRTSWNLKNLPQPSNKYQAQGFLLSIINNAAYPIGVPDSEKETTQIVEKYERYSTDRENNNKGIGTYWTSICDLGNLEYHFKSTFAPSQIWMNLKNINFTSGKESRIQHIQNYALHGWEGDFTKMFAKNAKK